MFHGLLNTGSLLEQNESIDACTRSFVATMAISFRFKSMGKNTTRSRILPSCTASRWNKTNWPETTKFEGSRVPSSVFLRTFQVNQIIIVRKITFGIITILTSFFGKQNRKLTRRREWLVVLHCCTVLQKCPRNKPTRRRSYCTQLGESMRRRDSPAISATPRCLLRLIRLRKNWRKEVFFRKIREKENESSE